MKGKICLLLGLMISNLCCQTKGSSKTNSDDQFISRIIGPGSNSPQESCSMKRAEIDDTTLLSLDKLAETLKNEPETTAFPFVPFDPPKEYFVVHQGHKILVAKYASTVISRQSSDQLVKIIDKKCDESKAKESK
ncbi:MAG: hypothetical protein HRU19_19050 [Pseudobacteriovorax sp.]|nr:hypothetical protein [Pseudobacteriovorax sp.]